jgi:hypothetical protein
MKSISCALLAISTLALVACGAVVDSVPTAKEGECFDVTPPADNTAQRDPADTSNGLVPQTY